MNVRFEASFAKDLRRLRDSQVKQRVRKAIESVKAADELNTLPNVRKLQGHDSFYRIRIGDYRIGFERAEDEIIFVRLLHRKDIYRRFP